MSITDSGHIKTGQPPCKATCAVFIEEKKLR